MASIVVDGAIEAGLGLTGWEPRRRQWTRDEYHRMRSAGVVKPGEPVALIDGVILLEGPDGPSERRWSRAEYDRMAESGVLGGTERVELIGGDVVEMSPQLSRHASALQLINRWMVRVCPPGYHVRAQLPLAIGRDSGPEPDVALVAGDILDYVEGHPSTAVWIGEVSDTTLAFDRETKSGLYASAGVPEYWIVDLVHDRVEVRCGPEQRPDEPFGWAYDKLSTYAIGKRIGPSILPGESVEVRELIPRTPRKS